MKIRVFNKFFLIIIVLACAKTSFSQQDNENKKQKEDAAIQHFINSKRYVFVAQTVLPMSGRAINLTTDYDVRVSGDTVVSDLPYFGRAYVAPIDPSEGGIHFTSTNFNYNMKERKKGGWDIAILPKDTKDVRQLLLSVTENGYGTLQVISNNRQQISYNGYIRERKSTT